MPEQMYTKCAECHLFVFPNSSYGDSPGLAEFEHGVRGDAADEQIDSSHAPVPGPSQTLDWWKVHGPAEMRARFTE